MNRDHLDRIRAILLAASIWFGSAHIAAADATMFLSPGSGDFVTLEGIPIRILAGTDATPVNIIEGTLSYDPKVVEITSVDLSANVISNWIATPAADNENGMLRFIGQFATGTVLDRTTLFQFTMKGKRSEDATISFLSGAAMHAADGTGGNILTAISPGRYRFVPAGEIEDGGKPATPGATPPPPAPASGVGATGGSGEVLGAATGTELYSLSHPDPTRWYTNATATFAWGAVPGTLGLRFSFTKNPEGKGATPLSTGALEQVVKSAPSGVSYAHLTRTFVGGSESTEHFRIQVDRDPPRFGASLIPREDSADPNLVFSIDAEDQLSGIDRFEVILDDGNPETPVLRGVSELTYRISGPGDHRITLAAIDRAGNRTEKEFTAWLGLLSPPVITLLPTYREDERLSLQIVGVANATVETIVEHGGSEIARETIALDAAGTGSLKSAVVLSPGTYTIFARQIDHRGAVSDMTEMSELIVRSTWWGIVKRNPFVPIAATLALLLSGAALYLWRRIRRGGSEDEGSEHTRDEYEEEDISSQHTPVLVRTERHPVTEGFVTRL